MIAAVPIAVLTNAGRVTSTAIMVYSYGKSAAVGTPHEVSGWLVYVVALALLLGLNFVLKKVFRGKLGLDERYVTPTTPARELAWARVTPLIAALVLSGALMNWFSARAEAEIPRRPLAELPSTLGEWQQRGGEYKFDVSTENILRTTDYTMREYVLPDGRGANLYVGYYGSQRTGATYHSPQHCLPGAGWVLSDPEVITVTTSNGRTFTANRYIVTNGVYTQVMLYWYQGRGRIEPSEYVDKINTIWDSVTRGRSDGALVRVMTDASGNQQAAEAAAADLAARVVEKLSPFVPE
jgi:EpsI family protein